MALHLPVRAAEKPHKARYVGHPKKTTLRAELDRFVAGMSRRDLKAWEVHLTGGGQVVIILVAS